MKGMVITMKIGIIGSLGHLHYIAEAKNYCTVTAYASGADEDMSAVAREYPQAKSIGSAEELLSIPELDMVAVNTYANLNAGYTSAALKCGLHVFSEKPLSVTLEGLADIETALGQGSAQLSCMLALRGEGHFLAAKRAVKEGLTGEVRMITSQKSYKLGKRPAYYRRNCLFGGLIPWVGIHAIDFMRYLSGLEYTEVTATASSLYNCGNGELELTSAAVYGMTGEVCATMTADYLRPAGAFTHEDDRVRIAGTRGVVEIRERKTILTDESGTRELTLPDNILILKSFIESIERGSAPLCSGTDAIASTRAALITDLSVRQKLKLSI